MGAALGCRATFGGCQPHCLCSGHAAQERGPMKLALITDIHANREALEAVLDHAQAQGASQQAFLGDFVGYGADPGWVVDTLREHMARGAWAVGGNHDEAVVRGPSPQMHAEARHIIGWTREQLDPAQRDFLAGLPMSRSVEQMLFVHANAHAPAEWGYIDSRGEAMRSLMATRARLVFCGHVHEPRLYYLSTVGKSGDFHPTPGMPIPLLPLRQWLVLPGSTGQPRDGNPAASYAIYDTEAEMLTFHRVPYDHELAADKIRRAGLPLRQADRLLHGH